MSRPVRLRLLAFLGSTDLARRYCLLLALFAIQGVAILAFYAFRGMDTSPDSLPLGLQLDPGHGVIHLVTGCVAALFAFRYPARAPIFVRLFAIFYLALAIFGTFTSIHFGMQLEFAENTLHWVIGLGAAVIGYAPLLRRVPRGS